MASAYQAVAGADLLVVMTEWPEFASVDVQRVAGLMTRSLVYDTRSVMDVAAASAAGLIVERLGHGIGLDPSGVALTA